MEMKDVVAMSTQLADKIISYKETGYTNISVKQVNDPNDNGELQEMVLIDMVKNKEQVEVRLFSHTDKDGKLIVKEKKGKVNG